MAVGRLKANGSILVATLALSMTCTESALNAVLVDVHRMIRVLFVRLGHGTRGIGFGLAGVSRSEEHTSELNSRDSISYAVFCLKKKKY